MRKDQLLGLLLKFDFGNNDTLKNAAANIDMPRCPGFLKKRCFSRVSSLQMVEMILSASAIGIYTQIPGAQYRSAVP